MPGPLVVSGKVIDAVTRKPIKAFRVVPGVRSSETHMNWVPSESFSASDGQFQHPRDARIFRASGSHRGRRLSGRGLAGHQEHRREGRDRFRAEAGERHRREGGDPAQPPRGASQGRAGSRRVSNQHPERRNRRWFNVLLREPRPTMRAASISRRRTKDFQLVITHPSGYAHIKLPPEWESARIIHLEPWARVEGTFRIGKTPAANVPITLDVAGRDSYGDDVPSIFTASRCDHRAGRTVCVRARDSRQWVDWPSHHV